MGVEEIEETQEAEKVIIHQEDKDLNHIENQIIKKTVIRIRVKKGKDFYHQ